MKALSLSFNFICLLSFNLFFRRKIDYLERDFLDQTTLVTKALCHNKQRNTMCVYGFSCVSSHILQKKKTEKNTGNFNNFRLIA